MGKFLHDKFNMNRKTRFFKNALLLQFIPLLLLGILIVSNFREQKILKIRELHPYEFNYGEFLPLIFFAVCCIAAIFTLFSKTPDVPEDDAEIVKIKRKQNFWKFAFYCNVFLLLVVSIFSVLVFQKEALIIDQPVHFYTIIFSRLLLVIVISLVVASFLLAAGIYWKTNKSLAAVILVFSFLMLTASGVSEFLFINAFVESSERYILSKAEKESSVNKEEVSEDYAESEETKEETSPEIDISMITASWNSMMEDFFIKKTGLSADFLGLRVYVYHIFAGQLFNNDYRVINYVTDLSDHPNELYVALETYKSVLFATVSREKYNNNHFDQVVDRLLLAYDDVGEDHEKLERIYEIMRNEIDSDEHNIGKYLPEIKKLCSSRTVKKLSENDGFCRYNSDVVWFYSFWARRNDDGNINEVVKILKDIQNHYRVE